VTFDEVEAILQGVAPRQKLFLMDTCESGEADEKAETTTLAQATSRGISSRGIKRAQAAATTTVAPPQTRRAWVLERNRYVYNDLLRRSGAVVLSSSRGSELSYERADLENGVFTHALIGAISEGKPIEIHALRDRVSKAVSEATGGLQNPTIDRDNLSAKFEL
jgi:hypothetical protein